MGPSEPNAPARRVGGRSSHRYNDDVASGIETVGEARDASQARRARNYRRVGLTIMGLIVLAAVLGLLGPRPGTVETTSGSYSLTIDYPQITRPGIDAQLNVQLRHAGDFDGPVMLAFDAGLFDRLDFRSWYPTPSAETADGERVIYEFDPPPGEVFELALDARTQSTQPPSAHHYEVAVLDEAGAVQLNAAFRVWVMP